MISISYHQNNLNPIKSQSMTIKINKISLSAQILIKSSSNLHKKGGKLLILSLKMSNQEKYPLQSSKPRI